MSEIDKNIFRRFLLNFLCIKAINIPLRFFIKILFPVLPNDLFSRMPVVGLIELKVSPPLPKKIYLYNNGHDHIASQQYWRGIDSYESETIKLFLELLKYSKTVFDIGANNGLYSIIAARIDYKNDVYAFEPVPEIIKVLNRNISINKLTNIKVISQAVSEKEEIRTIYIPELAGNVPTSASLLKDFRSSTKKMDLQTITVDSFVKAHNIKSVDLIKMDTEGTEHEILQGASDTLKKYHPIIICEVLSGLTEKFLMPILEREGYLYFWITSEGLIQKNKIEGDPTYKFPNYLFITEERSKEVLRGIEMPIVYLK